jgi:hypothetical protein
MPDGAKEADPAQTQHKKSADGEKDETAWYAGQAKAR